MLILSPHMLLLYYYCVKYVMLYVVINGKQIKAIKTYCLQKDGHCVWVVMGLENISEMHHLKIKKIKSY